MTGRFAPEMARTARWTWEGDGSGMTGACTASGLSAASSAIDWSATSSGNSKCVAPGFSVWAILKALRTASGMTSARGMEAFHLVTGLNIAIASMYWWDSLWRRFREACPVIVTSGA